MQDRGRTKPFGFPRSLRLVQTADFGRLVRAQRGPGFCLRGHWLVVYALRHPEPGQLRVGVTVSKRLARRSVDRVLVKRILRESARLKAPRIRTAMADSGVGLDACLRLRAPLSDIRGESGVRTLKARLREDADRLMGLLEKRVRTLGAGRSGE